MKKINSIGYGGKLLGAAAVFCVPIPAVLKAFTLVCGKNIILNAAGKVSLGIGIVIFLFFAGLLAVEFHQDKRVNLAYESQKKSKICFQQGRYECQACGNTKVTAEDKVCRICGILFLSSTIK